jgi:hypothetical protein
VDFEMTILTAPVSSFTRTLSGVRADIENPESSKSFTAIAKFDIIDWSFFGSMFSMIYYYFILSTRSAIKVESSRMPA